MTRPTRRRRETPTINYLVPLTLAACTEKTRELYGTYLRLLAERHGNDLVNELVPSDIVAFRDWAQAAAVRRKSSIDGRSAGEHAVAAARKLFSVAILDGYITSNPALKVEKPRRHDPRRHALSDEYVKQVFDAVKEEETAVIRFLVETACRREGLLNLAPQSLRPARQTVLLDEKNTKIREQPISAELAEYLADPDCPLYGWTRRRLDGLWTRTREKLPWAEEIGLSTHWFRHTTITRCEQVTGSYAVTAAFAGHKLREATATYINIGIEQVARAFSMMFDEPHPLAASSF